MEHGIEMKTAFQSTLQICTMGTELSECAKAAMAVLAIRFLMREMGFRATPADHNLPGQSASNPNHAQRRFNGQCLEAFENTHSEDETTTKFFCRRGC
jgi:hypothetical protein